MKTGSRKYLMLIAVVTLVFVAGAMLPAAARESFQAVVDNLNINKNTKLHVKEYWKGIEGQEVVWSGVVVDVKGGRGKAQVMVHNKTRPSVKGSNIIIIVHDISKAAKLKKGQNIRFKGMLHNYSQGRGGGIVITLRESDIL